MVYKNDAEISGLIAEPLGGLVDAVQSRFYGDRALDVDLIRDFHSAFLGDVVPGIAGRWRDGPVQVGKTRPNIRTFRLSRINRLCIVWRSFTVAENGSRTPASPMHTNTWTHWAHPRSR
jgi:hypothetical protein